jgi:NADH-quinone oxidoreductase subunit J
MHDVVHLSFGPLAAGVLNPVAILALCVVAGVATVMLLPSRREASYHKLGGVILLSAFLVFAAILIRQSAGGFSELYFWLFSAVAVISAVRVVTHPRPVYSALYFVLTVFATAGLFVLLWAEFMAAALILIYAGAILVTYVFVIMLAAQASNQSAEQDTAEYDQVSREPVVASAIGFTLMAVLLLLIFDKASVASVPTFDVPDQGVGVRDLGQYLFSKQLVTLELAGVILTLAMVGAILIARRQVSSESGVQEVFKTSAALPDVESDPHTIPIYGTDNPQAKAYPER